MLGFNRELDEATASAIAEPGRFIECIIAPGFSAGRLGGADHAPKLEEKRAFVANRPVGKVRWPIRSGPSSIFAGSTVAC